MQHMGFLYCDSFIEWISNIVPMWLLIWHLFDMIKLLEQQCSFNIFSANYDDETEHAQYLQTNEGTRRRSSINTRGRGTTLSKLSETEIDHKHVEKQRKSEENDEDLLLNAYHEPSASFETNTVNDDDDDALHTNIDGKSEAIMAWFDGDKYHENEVVNGDDDDVAYEHMMNKAQVPSAKMIRNKHKNTKRMFICCRVIAILFILYGIVIIIGITLKLNHSHRLCSRPTKQQIEQQPNLLVWDKCEYVLHPLWFNYGDNLACECLKFKWITAQTEAPYVLQSVLNDFKMLQIVYIEWYSSLQNISNVSSSFASRGMRALYLSNVNMAQSTFDMPVLEVLNVRYSKWSFDTVNKSLVSSPYLRILSLQNMNLYSIPTSICTLSHLQTLDLSATFIEYIPSCFVSFNAPLQSFNLLFNALSGKLHKELLNRKDMKLMIATTQMIEGIDDDDDEFDRKQLYLQYNPLCDSDNDKMYCDESVMCSMHCLDLFHSDNICDPFCNVAECDYDATDCDDHDECKSVTLWFQTLDTNSNGVIDEKEMKQNTVSLIFNLETNISKIDAFPLEFDSFVDLVWINDINCSHIN